MDRTHDTHTIRHTFRALQGLAAILLIALVAVTAGCSKNDNPVAPFAGPNLSGTWTGKWGTTEAIMTLNQTGGSASGQLTLGVHTYDITGTVSTSGVFQFGGRTTQPDVCDGVNSAIDDMVVSSDSNSMEGVVQRRVRNAANGDPCGGGRTAVTQGLLALERVAN